MYKELPKVLWRSITRDYLSESDILALRATDHFFYDQLKDYHRDIELQRFAHEHYFDDGLHQARLRHGNLQLPVDQVTEDEDRENPLLLLNEHRHWMNDVRRRIPASYLHRNRFFYNVLQEIREEIQICLIWDTEIYFGEEFDLFWLPHDDDLDKTLKDIHPLFLTAWLDTLYLLFENCRSLDSIIDSQEEGFVIGDPDKDPEELLWENLLHICHRLLTSEHEIVALKAGCCLMMKGEFESGAKAFCHVFKLDESYVPLLSREVDQRFFSGQIRTVELHQFLMSEMITREYAYKQPVNVKRLFFYLLQSHSEETPLDEFISSTVGLAYEEGKKQFFELIFRVVDNPYLRQLPFGEIVALPRHVKHLIVNGIFDDPSNAQYLLENLDKVKQTSPLYSLLCSFIPKKPERSPLPRGFKVEDFSLFCKSRLEYIRIRSGMLKYWPADQIKEFLNALNRKSFKSIENTEKKEFVKNWNYSIAYRGLKFLNSVGRIGGLYDALAPNRGVLNFFALQKGIQFADNILHRTILIRAEMAEDFEDSLQEQLAEGHVRVWLSVNKIVDDCIDQEEWFRDYIYNPDVIENEDAKYVFHVLTAVLDDVLSHIENRENSKKYNTINELIFILLSKVSSEQELASYKAIFVMLHQKRISILTAFNIIKNNHNFSLVDKVLSHVNHRAHTWQFEQLFKLEEEQLENFINSSIFGLLKTLENQSFSLWYFIATNLNFFEQWYNDALENPDDISLMKESLQIWSEPQDVSIRSKATDETFQVMMFDILFWLIKVKNVSPDDFVENFNSRSKLMTTIRRFGPLILLEKIRELKGIKDSNLETLAQSYDDDTILPLVSEEFPQPAFFYWYLTSVDKKRFQEVINGKSVLTWLSQNTHRKILFKMMEVSTKNIFENLYPTFNGHTPWLRKLIPGEDVVIDCLEGETFRPIDGDDYRDICYALVCAGFISKPDYLLELMELFDSTIIKELRTNTCEVRLNTGEVKTGNILSLFSLASSLESLRRVVASVPAKMRSTSRALFARNEHNQKVVDYFVEHAQSIYDQLTQQTMRPASEYTGAFFSSRSGDQEEKREDPELITVSSTKRPDPEQSLLEPANKRPRVEKLPIEEEVVSNLSRQRPASP